MYQRHFHNGKYEDRVKLAREKIILLLKEKQNREQSGEFLKNFLYEQDVLFEDVVRSGPRDQYQIVNHNGYYKIQAPAISDKEQLIQFFKDNQGFNPIDHIILESSYRNAKSDIENLDKEGRLIIKQIQSQKEMKIYILKEQLFENKQELAQFKEWYKDDYEIACKETMKLINDENFQKQNNYQSNKEKTKRNLVVVNSWIFPDGLPQEFKL